MNFPTPIQKYFDADRQGDEPALVGAFAADALVRDEGRAFVGGRAIATWWRESRSRYQPVLEPLEAVASGGTTTVRTRVSGAFPGSPVVLSFAFRLDGERIAALEIKA